MSELDRRVAQVRTFNRFYTRQIGVLEEGMLDSSFTLAEARVLFELWERGGARASELARELDMDPAQISRIVTRLRGQDLVAAAPAPGDARAQHLTPTAAGKAAAQGLNARSDALVQKLLQGHDPEQQQSLVRSMAHIEAILTAGQDREAAARETVLRAPRIGDLGWLSYRQGRIYNQEYGWDQSFEALVARIYADFEASSGTPPKKLWVADRGGVVLGSIMIVPNADDPTAAQLRLLYVEPFARGLGLGGRLVETAVAFSRDAGYARIMLWTQDCLTAARSVYERAGFRLEREEKHTSFGADLNGQYLGMAL